MLQSRLKEVGDNVVLKVAGIGGRDSKFNEMARQHRSIREVAAQIPDLSLDELFRLMRPHLAHIPYEPASSMLVFHARTDLQAIRPEFPDFSDRLLQELGEKYGESSPSKELSFNVYANKGWEANGGLGEVLRGLKGVRSRKKIREYVAEHPDFNLEEETKGIWHLILKRDQGELKAGFRAISIWFN